MFNQRTIAVIKKELKEKLFSKAFIFMTVLIPIFMFGILGFQTYILSIEGDEGTKLQIVSESEIILSSLESEFLNENYVKDSSYTMSYVPLKDISIDEYVTGAKSSLLAGKFDGIVYIPEDALQHKKIGYYSDNPNNRSVSNKVRPVVNKVLLDIYFTESDLSEEDLNFARSWVDMDGFRVSAEEGIQEEGVANRVASFLLAFLLYFSLLILGSMMLRSVVEEKTSRIVEVLLSSVSSLELITGKILGNTIVGAIQMMIWLSPIMLLVSTSWFALPPEFTLYMDMGQIGYFILNYFVGLFVYMGLFAAVGSIFDNEQDAQSGQFPIIILIMIPFFISLSLTNNPDSPLATISSIAPFSSIIVMPARMTLIDVPLFQIILSFVLNIATMLFTFFVASKIYRVGILMTGKKPKWGEVIKWLKYKY